MQLRCGTNSDPALPASFNAQCCLPVLLLHMHKVKSQHDTAIAEVRRMAAEAGHLLERDRDLTDMVKKAQQSALDDVKKLQSKYVARA